ncbi:MAG: DUF488 family protein [Xanthobacteraceae bacterium]|jgi:uncharacterized protein (DUF488 family)|uniref:DUF488 domain-containing protein n=1 Tax=Pseudolabrys sp. TaxID=1960880 RepID=UPI003D13339E
MTKTAKKATAKKPAAKKTKPKKAAAKRGGTPTLFTIGYELAKPAAIFKELKDAKVDILVDTRAVAASRRPGFSKTQLAAGLDDEGIAYVHLQKLGTPAEGRHAARAGDIETLWKIYDKYVRKPEPQEALDELIALIKSKKRIALLCYCRDPNACHRSRIVALVKKRMTIKVEDLIPPLM